ncbi:hypothetical protein HYV43_02200 [Candidatus Micrarchaeota archaeon]|nr:hypothetical protein [Candidatus Micrarchaeota archaeon]
MDLLKGIGAFVDGIRSVVSVSAIVEEKISNSVACGVEEGLERAAPVLIRAGLTASLLITGVIWMGFGAGRYLEAALDLPGLGYFAVGLGIALVGAVLHFQKSGMR